MATSLLLVDDSPTIAKILQMALQNEPYEIRAVQTAEDAIKELRAQPPFFFLVDLTLPGTNGYEFARLIKKDSKLRQVRVVLLASAFEPVNEEEVQNCGADTVIKKPFDPSDLRNKLRAIVGAPPKFPAGARVVGSLSGFTVNAPEEPVSKDTSPPPASLPSSGAKPEPVPEPALDPISLFSENSSPDSPSDADSILAGILGGDSNPSTTVLADSDHIERTPELLPHDKPAASVPEQKTLQTEFTQNTVSGTIALDLTTKETDTSAQNQESVLDLSRSFNTPAGGTAMIDLSSVGERTRAEIFAPVAAPTNPSPAAPVEDLSPNAQALAAFFEAEIGSKEVQKPAASAPKASETQPQPKKEQSDAFESSLGSIDWNEGPAASSLQQWSANQPAGKPASTDNPPPFQKTMEKPQARTAPAGAATSISPGESTSFLFDTGKSNFRFSEDYIHRITKSFSGATEENVPEKHSVFPQQSDDRRQNQEIITPPEKNSAVPAGKLTSPRAGGGAWSEQDVAMIEKIVREEVQMVVREVAEKIAWEVIPELAENLIRKELEKVMKDLGQ